ncbi:MAG: CHAD domain-containing protein [Nostocaceae cyanobacterium]|nr:CHAD domain-containing protein [Nostocaceae cyanobacterium]
MQVNTNPAIDTLADGAYVAIEKHFKKVLKWESSVKKDEEPEALHQMRVGMRRLRTAVTGFALALDLPKSVSDKNIGKIARILGKLRDLDVLKDALTNRYQSHLPSKEQKSLNNALDALDKQRKDVFSDVEDTLKHERYKSIKQGVKEWLADPKYHDVAHLKIQPLLPDLLLPEVSRFLLHPGWLVATEIQEFQVVNSGELTPGQVEENLANQGKILHELRKEAKRLRYQMELFPDFYGESYATYLSDVKAIQEMLGEIQDSMVLEEWLTDVLKSEIATQLPTLAAELANNRYQAWQQWQPLQQRYLNSQVRQRLHLTILYPQESNRVVSDS